jgi:hypothetical protein
MDLSLALFLLTLLGFLIVALIAWRARYLRNQHLAAALNESNLSWEAMRKKTDWWRRIGMRILTGDAVLFIGTIVAFCWLHVSLHW